MAKYFRLSLFLLFAFAAASNSNGDIDSNSCAFSPYLPSQSLFLSNYQRMLRSFKIFAYPQPPLPSSSSYSPSVSLFHSSLLKSPFLTANGGDAHLFYLPLPAPDSSTRTTARLIRDLRSDHPYWNRSLGADHFYVSSGGGVGYESNRNMVELKKNSIQISCSPANEGKFVPHKDIILPALGLAPPATTRAHSADSKGAKFLIVVRGASEKRDGFLRELSGDPDFLLLQSDEYVVDEEKRRLPRFRLFIYGESDLLSEIGEALRSGWAPVIVSDRPILDLPFADVLKWSEMAVFVGAKGGAREMKKRLLSLLDGGERMRELGKMAAQHFVWNPSSSPQPYDAFHTVLYQLWLRRHVVRYAQRTPFK